MTDQSTDTARNPLLAAAGPPRFADIAPEHIEPAVTAVLADQRAALERAAAAPAADLAWLEDLELIQDAVERVWSPVAHLNAVASSPALREAFNRCLPLMTEFQTELGQNEALFRQFERLAARLPPDRQVETELVAQSLRDFRLGGVDLAPAEKERFRETSRRLVAAEAEFEQNLMDAADAFRHHETRAEAVEGLPAVVLDRARAAAVGEGLEGWLFALDSPTYQTVMSHARSAALRELFYRAWVTRASDQGPLAGRWDNGPLIAEILALRHAEARLLGFADYAELSLATKMAESPRAVLAFVQDLARRSRGAGERELAELEAQAGRPLEAWDIGYYSEQARRERFGLDEESLRAYFPLPRVLEGLFGLVERLFGVAIAAAPAAAPWHSSVAYYDVHRADGSRVGGFYTDLFARANKRSGAWMDACLTRARLRGHSQDPVAYLVCNFTPPVGGAPSLLTHNEVVTLFHEFGHTLHHLLTTVDYPSLAGVNGVAWDAIELPSQFLENYAWESEVLRTISGHVETGESLPAATIETLRGSRRFLAGLAMLRQLEFALFDIRLHTEPEPPSLLRVYAILDEVRREVAVIRQPAYNRFPSGFAHIFAGGYAAGYYSYKWAEVLAADAFSAFAERGPLDAGTAARFEREVLRVGGSRPALAAFTAFRGRGPELGALLAQAGITEGP